MARIFTEEWLAERTRKQAQSIGSPVTRPELARQWNGNVVPVELGSKRPVIVRNGSSVGKTDLYPLIALCRAARLPEPVAEYRFHATRGWMFDYAIVAHRLAIEVEGGIWKKGGGAHSHPLNIIRDIEKYNEATLLGWRILRVVPERLTDALDLIVRALAPTRGVA